jgi:hypothetical protein
MIFYSLKSFLPIALLCAIYSTVFAENQHPEKYESLQTREFDFEGISFDEEDDYPFMNDYLDATSSSPMVRAIDPIQIMVILNLLGIPLILQEPLFLHTNILSKRSLLDQPIFEPLHPELTRPWLLSLNAFARKTTRSNFTRGSDKLESWLALSQHSLIDKIEQAIANANRLASDIQLDIDEIFSLFRNMTVEERQVGFMLQGIKRWKKVTLRIMAPLYYQESNFSLTKKEQDEVARVLGALEPEEEKRFRKAHFISDKIGLGDTRLEVDGRVVKRPGYSLRVGGLATIPTAWMWGGGFLGSSFAKPSMLPRFDLEPIFDALVQGNNESTEQIMLLLRDFFLDAFDRVAADLIDVPLGNRGHLGLGIYTRDKIPLGTFFNTWFAQRLKFASRTSIELFVPAREKRSYINKINEQAFGDHNFENFDLAAENVQFLKDQAIARLFLRGFSTTIVPGVIFRWNGGLYYKGDIFGFNVGLDYWLQNKPRFSSIHALPKTLAELDILKARQPVAQQSKLFGAFLFKIKSERCTYFCSINADASLNTKGLGQDYSLALNFESSF